MKKICFFVITGLSILGCSYAADRNLYQGKYMFETACKLENGIYYDGGRPMITHASSIVNSGDIHPLNIPRQLAIESFVKSGNYIHFLVTDFEKSLLGGYTYNCLSGIMYQQLSLDTFNDAKREDNFYRYNGKIINLSYIGESYNGPLVAFDGYETAGDVFYKFSKNGFSKLDYLDLVGGTSKLIADLKMILTFFGASNIEINKYLDTISQCPNLPSCYIIDQRIVFDDKKSHKKLIQFRVGGEPSFRYSNILAIAYITIDHNGNHVIGRKNHSISYKNNDIIYTSGGIEWSLGKLIDYIPTELIPGTYSDEKPIFDINDVNLNLTTAKNLFNTIGYFGECASKLGCYSSGIVAKLGIDLGVLHLSEIKSISTQGNVLYITVVLDDSGMSGPSVAVKKKLKIYDKNGKTYIEEVK